MVNVETFEAWVKRGYEITLLQTQQYTLVASPVKLSTAVAFAVDDHEGFDAWLAKEKVIPYVSAYQAKQRGWMY